jgi:hypothetical protein
MMLKQIQGESYETILLVFDKNIIYLFRLFNNCNSFYFAQNILWKLFNSNAGTRWFACEVFLIDCVKCSKICHFSKEAGCFNDIVKAKSGCFKNCTYIFAGLLCLSFNCISCNFTCCWVYRKQIQSFLSFLPENMVRLLLVHF